MVATTVPGPGRGTKIGIYSGVMMKIQNVNAGQERPMVHIGPKSSAKAIAFPRLLLAMYRPDQKPKNEDWVAAGFGLSHLSTDSTRPSFPPELVCVSSSY
jgi:hypothetical protein